MKRFDACVPTNLSQIPLKTIENENTVATSSLTNSASWNSVSILSTSYRKYLPMAVTVRRFDKGIGRM